ncbi:MAG: protein kinase [Candidatus Schekmanbacteria bacterium]|nr:protein kinase [Candidatus Schekmanbacteria bacterium]
MTADLAICPRCRASVRVRLDDSRLRTTGCPFCGSTALFRSEHGAEPAGEARDEATRLEGQVIGGCRVEAEIGRGAMGVVFRAHHLALDIPVALKTLHADIATAGAENIERFVREAQAAARLQHQNIVGVLNVGQENGVHYILMQYVDGETLQDRLARERKLAVEEALSIVAQVCDALEMARRHRIVHRDIKPSNIIIDASGIVRLMDLGLAKCVDSGVEVTQTGATLGTPLFMSPEQVRDSTRVDHRSDLYSLGCTLYWAICGQPPYRGQSPMNVLMQHINAPIPDPCDLDRTIPLPVAALIRRLLAKSPAERFQTARELAAEIADILRQLGSSKAPPPDDEAIDLQRARILVADDMKPIRFFFEMTLGKANATVSQAENGLVALHLLTKAMEDGEPFDLLVTDVHMPKMDGLELLRRIRNDPELRGIPVLVITMENDESIVLELAQLGISGYVVKPPRARQILGMARQALDATAAWRAQRAASGSGGGLSVEQTRCLCEALHARVEHAVLGAECHRQSLWECPAYVTVMELVGRHCPDALEK